MALITLQEFQAYTKTFDDADLMSQIYMGAAEQIVIDYLGYNPELDDFSEFLSGSDSRRIRLSSKPITEITSVTINGESVSLDQFYIREEYLTFFDPGKKFPKGDENVQVEYKAGWVEVPQIIKLTTLRIAALMNTEADGNIGVTSKSFGDSGSRTFISVTKYDKYLFPLNEFRITKI